MINETDSALNERRRKNFLSHIERLKDEGYDSYAKIAKEFPGVNASFLSQVISGGREVTGKIANSYEEYFRLPTGYFSATSPSQIPKHVDIVEWGKVDAYSGADIEGIIGKVENVTSAMHVVAVKPRGETLLPYFADGDILYIDYAIPMANIHDKDIVVYEDFGDMSFWRMTLMPNGELKLAHLCGQNKTGQYIGKLIAKTTYY